MYLFNKRDPPDRRQKLSTQTTKQLMNNFIHLTAQNNREALLFLCLFVFIPSKKTDSLSAMRGWFPSTLTVDHSCSQLYKEKRWLNVQQGPSDVGTPVQQSAGSQKLNRCTQNIYMETAYNIPAFTSTNKGC